MNILISIFILVMVSAGFCAEIKMPDISGTDNIFIGKIERKSRAAYLDIFSAHSNPVGMETRKMLTEHPEIAFKIGMASDETSPSWCSSKERIVYTDVRYLKKYWGLDKLANDDKVFQIYIKENAATVAHELTHMCIFIDWPYNKIDPAKLGRKPFTKEWNERYSNATEYLGYLVEQAYVGFEMLKDPLFVSKMSNHAFKWRWEYYSQDLEKYCKGVLNMPCSRAGLEDIKEPLYPEIDAFYRDRIAEQIKLRTEVLARPVLLKSEYKRYLIAGEDFAAESPSVITSTQAKEDLDILEELIKEAYAGYEYFGSRGMDWPRLFDGIKQELDSKPVWAATQYYNLLMKHLATADIQDNHLSLKINTAGKQYWHALFASHWIPHFAEFYVSRENGKFYLIGRDQKLKDNIELIDVQGKDPLGFLFPTYVKDLPGETYLLGTLGRSSTDYLDCTVKIGTAALSVMSLPLHPIRVKRQADMPVFESKIIDGIPYIALRSMRDQYASELMKFVQSARKVRSSPVVILDMRGTSGGSDGWGIKWLSELTNGVLRPNRAVSVIVSPATLQGKVNSLRENLFQASDKSSKELVTRRLREAEEELELKEKEGVKRHWEPKTFELSGSAPGKFKGTLLVISNALNASAGEGFLETLKGLGKQVIVLGENSRGVNTFGPLYPYPLPNSRIKIYLAQGITLYRDEVYESKGIPPDIWIDEDDILPSVLEYAKKYVPFLDKKPDSGKVP